MVLEALVSAVLLAAILQWAGIHQVLHELSRTQLRWFVPAVLVSIATVPLMAFRWRLLLSAKRIDVPIAWLTRTYFVALFAGQFLPAAIGGDAVRAVELGRRTHDAPEAVASVLIDRLVGLVSLVVLALAAVIAGGGSARRPGVIAAEAAFGLPRASRWRSSSRAGCAASWPGRSSRAPTVTGWPPASASTTLCIRTAATRAPWPSSARSRSSCSSPGWASSGF